MRSPRSAAKFEPLVGDVPVVVSVIDVFQRDRLQPAARRLGKAELDRRRLRLGRLQTLHAGDLLELALRLAREAGLGAEAVGETLQALDLALLRFVSGHLLLAARDALERGNRRSCPGNG